MYELNTCSMKLLLFGALCGLEFCKYSCLKIKDFMTPVTVSLFSQLVI